MVGYHQCNALGRDEPRVLLPPGPIDFSERIVVGDPCNDAPRDPL